jgi:hypothetical protein
MKKSKIWPLFLVFVLLLAGFAIWDFVKHRRVQEYVFTSPEIPGASLAKVETVQAAAFHRLRETLTRRMTAGDVRISVTWNTPEFFRALAAAEGEQDIKRHETLYHAYAERFNVHGSLVFTVVMNSDSVDLRAHAVRDKSLLRNDKAISVAPWQWSEARGSSSRHLEGVLSFPQRTEAGSPLMGHRIGEHLPGESPAVWIELVLNGLPSGEEAVFRWDLPSAAQETGS